MHRTYTRRCALIISMLLHLGWKTDTHEFKQRAISIQRSPARPNKGPFSKHGIYRWSAALLNYSAGHVHNNCTSCVLLHLLLNAKETLRCAGSVLFVCVSLTLIINSKHQETAAPEDWPPLENRRRMAAASPVKRVRVDAGRPAGSSNVHK